MSPELVMYLCRMNALVACIEGMKIANAVHEQSSHGCLPPYREDQFFGVQSELDRLASAAGSLMS